MATDKDLQDQVDYIADMLSNADKYAAMRREDMGDDFDENEHTGAYDWLSDVLDIQYIVNGNGDFISAKVLVAFGGPNIWVDFQDKTVRGYWWQNRANATFDDDMDIEGALAEMWSVR